MKLSGLYDRYRDPDGKIRKQYGDTLISTLRAKCGFDFALGIPGKVKLADVLNDLDEASLGQLVRAPSAAAIHSRRSHYDDDTLRSRRGLHVG